MGDSVEDDPFAAVKSMQKVKDPFFFAHFVASTGYELVELRDEIYLQLMKQTTENPNPRSMMSGWVLLLLCCRTFLPSEEFLPFVHSCFEAATHHRFALPLPSLRIMNVNV